MKISYNLTKSLLAKLPIGFYLKRTVEVRLSEKESANYYDPIEDRITISYPSIKAFVKDKEFDNDKIEDAIRDILYHELSHVILTPKGMYTTAIQNVFEDERIETALREYYHRVDFKKFVKDFNDYDNIGESKDAFQVFYKAVRFREGKDEYLDIVENIICKYIFMNCGSEDRTYKPYLREINDLYELIKKDWEEEHSSVPEGKPDDTDDGDDKSSKDESDNGDKKPDEKGKNNDKSDDGNGSGSSVNGGDGSGNGSSNGTGEELSQEEADEAEERRKREAREQKAKEQLEEKVGSENIGEKLVSKGCEFLFNQFKDEVLKGKLRELIFRNTARRQNAGAASASYTGKFQPKQVLRDDYKWFLKKDVNGSYKRFKDIQLNLFIDVSGSFSGCQNTINTLLKSLIEIEKSRSDFKVKVAAMGTTNRVLPDDKRKVNCTEGNNLDETIFPVYNSLQDKSKSCYNIVVFDGDAQSFDNMFDKGWGYIEKLAKEKAYCFSVFNHPNTTIISDTYNKAKIEKYCPRCKSVFTDRYLEELTDNILKMLAILLRS